MPTLLTLSPAFGGKRFGPFPGGSVSVGSDPQCNVVLDASLGVAPCHAWITERGAIWTIQPGSPGVSILVSVRGGSLTPLRGPTDLGVGDSFVLGSPSGPSLTVGGGAIAASTPRGGPAPTPRPGPVRSGRGMPSAGALADEAARQAQVEAMRSGPVQDVSRFLFRLKSGSFLRPQYIIGAVVAILGGAFVSCASVVTWIVAHL